jgi:Na+/melibiose symporter-like transporter
MASENKIEGPQPCPFGGTDYVKVSVLVFAVTALWQSLHSIILPLRVLDFVPEASKNTYLGVLTFTGLILAMFAQPLAGALSDRARSPRGRRRPFILGGIVALSALLFGLALAPTYAVLFVSYCLMQVAANAAQGPYQAFLPELVPPTQRGRAAGVKNALEIVGGIAFVGLSSLLMARYSAAHPGWLWLNLGLLGVLLLATLVLTLAWVREPALTIMPLRTPVLAMVLNTFKLDLKRERTFFWFLLSRLMVFMALTTVQQFALYFFRDVLKLADPAGATFKFLAVAIAGMLIAAYPAGRLCDRKGRLPIAFASALLGGLAVLLILVLPKQYNLLLIPAGLLGLALGAFSTTNWAMATNLVVKGQEARYLGLANMATAGGGALARLIGPVIDYFNARGPNLGYSVMLIFCLVYFVGGAIILLKVHPSPSV